MELFLHKLDFIIHNCLTYVIYLHCYLIIIIWKLILICIICYFMNFIKIECSVIQYVNMMVFKQFIYTLWFVFVFVHYINKSLFTCNMTCVYIISLGIFHDVKSDQWIECCTIYQYKIYSLILNKYVCKISL